ncbi:MAG: efflux RND transporter periplasmic adaptor subunit [bacterium]
MKKLIKDRIYLGMLLVLAAAGVAWATGAFSDSYRDLEFATASRGSFVLDVVVRGELKAERSRSIRVPSIRGRTQVVWLAPEGEAVESGQVVARLDTGDLENRLDQRQQELETAMSNLDNFLASKPGQIRQAENGVTTAELDLEAAQIQLDLSEFESEQQQEQRRLAYENALLNLDNAERELEAIRTKLEVEERQLRTDIRKRQQRVDDVKEQLEAAELTAPISGILIYGENFSGGSEGTRKVRVGDSAHRGQTILQIPDLTEMLVEMKVAEGDYRKVAPGQGVELRIDAIPDVTFTGTVEELSALANFDPERRAGMFEAVARLDSVEPGMRPGMTASVRIITDEVQDALYIPNRAVFEVEGETVVFPRSQLPRPRVVRLGERNMNAVEVLEGLEEGEEVALEDPRRTGEESQAASPLPGGASSTRPGNSPAGNPGGRR